MARAKKTSLPNQLDELEALYGAPSAPLSDPYELILFENIGYLVDDERRAELMKMLKKQIGLKAAKILAAPRAKLRALAELGGMQPDGRVEKLLQIASLVVEEHAGDLTKSLSAESKKARRALKKFPGIGDPGADKILLFSRREPVAALESNGLRVLARLGLAQEDKSYTKTYQSGTAVVAKEVEESFDARIRAFQLLRRHGQELCKRSAPLCERCPLQATCPTGQADRRV